MAEIRRHTDRNIVAIKSTVEHDASGIRDTMEEEMVSLMYSYISRHFCYSIIRLSCQELDGAEHGTYKVYVFGKGVFVNKGDGGFTNICCIGKYNQAGGRFTFQEP